jgi:hypothetical protein
MTSIPDSRKAGSTEIDRARWRAPPAIRSAVAGCGSEYQSIGDTFVQRRSTCRRHNIVKATDQVFKMHPKQ